MTAVTLRCVECGTGYDEAPDRLVCDACATAQAPGGSTRGVLQVELGSLPDAWPAVPPASPAFLAAFLPVHPRDLPDFPVGGTPLLAPHRLRDDLGMRHLWLKDDTRNPSGSTKDRASLLVAAKARQFRRDTIAVASTGNAATALGAVAAAAGFRAVAFVPASAPDAKLVQLMSYGADVLPVDGSYDDAFELCLAACGRFGWYNRNTALNPFTTEGKKTVALEIAAAMAPDAPDVVVVPTGDGVIVSGVAKGFRDLAATGLIGSVPRLVAVQPAGSAALARALRAGAATVDPVRGAASIADSLVVEAPRNAVMALRDVRASGGTGITVSDDAIIAAIARLARATGIFAEPAAAAALAGLDEALAQGAVDRDERVVLLITGTGLKDVPAAARAVRRPEPVAADLEAVTQRLALG